MTRSARHAAFVALVAIVGCSVYDQSLLTGSVGGAGSVSGEGGGRASGGAAGSPSGRGGTTGGSASSGGHGSSGGSAATGGGSSGGTGGSRGGAGGDGSGATGGTTGGTDASGGTSGDAAGGTGNVDASGGMGDDGGAPDPGAGGTSGTGGGDPGTGGSAGMGTGGGAGMASGGSAGGPPAMASGCAKLTAALTASTDKTHYLITLGSADVDFTDAVVNVHLFAEGSDGGVFLYVQQATYEFYGMPLVPFSTFSGWTTLTWDLSAAASTSPVDKAKVRRLGLEIGGTGGTDFVNPTVVYIDDISVSSPALSFSFDAASSVTTTPTTYHAGDTALWQNSASADTTATGSTLEWVTSCP